MVERAPENRGIEEYERMQRRIVGIFTDPMNDEAAREDSIATFISLGLDTTQAHTLFEAVRQRILDGSKLQQSLDEVEKAVLTLFRNTLVGEKNLVQVLDEKLVDRAKIIFAQVQPYMKGSKGDVLDFGAGDMQVTQMLQDTLSLKIQGADVRDYRKTGAEKPVPFQLYDGEHLPFTDGSFSTSLATNVLHHAGETDDRSAEVQSNNAALNELCRVTKDKIVIIETVPDPKHVVLDADRAMERTFWNDYLYNRLFHSADVPVPGRYETAEGWPVRFAEKGWKVIETVHLGYDQPTIRDYHILYVLQRDNDIPKIQTGTRSAGSVESALGNS